MATVGSGSAPDPTVFHVRAEAGRAMTVDRAEIVARYPGLAPLLAVQGPPWRLYAHDVGPVHGERRTDSYYEVFYMAGPESVCGIRETFSRWPGPAVRPVDFVGSLEQVVERLLAPAEPESEP